MPEINHESWEDAELEYPATWREECMCQARTCKEVGRVHGGVCTEGSKNGFWHGYKSRSRKPAGNGADRPNFIGAIGTAGFVWGRGA